MGQKLKVLISAYACRPGEGSEPGIGWEVAQELAKYYQVWVLTRESNRASITAELAKYTKPPLNMIFCDLPGSVLWRRGQGGIHLHYYLWQIRAYYAARQMHQAIQFDLVHHVTYVRYSAPSFLSLLPIPFIWGPVGGGECAPKEFWHDFSLQEKGYEMLRNLACWIGENDPFVRMTASKSVLSWATTTDTADRLRYLKVKNVQVLSQLGLSDDEICQLAQHFICTNSSVRFISIGRLLHWKGFHLGLKAFAQADLPRDAEYWILGDGPQRTSLQSLAQKLGIADRVKFWSKLPREEVLKMIKECIGLIHPSLHESGGMVCLEAMAAGCPVICLDLGGPALLVTTEVGIRVPAQNPEQAVTDVARAMTTLARDKELRVRMGLAGQQHVRERYSWTVRGQELRQLYERVLNESKNQTSPHSMTS